MKKLLYAGLFFIVAQSLCAQVRIITENGSIEGYFTNKTDSLYTIRSYSDGEFFIYENDILSTKYLESIIILKTDSSLIAHIYKIDSNKVYYIDNDDKKYKIDRENIKTFEPDNYRHGKYPIIGWTFGYPGGFNMLFGYQFKNPLNVRAEIGFDGTTIGLLTSLGINLSRNDEYEHNISFGIGAMKHNINNENENPDVYSEISYSLNFHGFFGEIGLDRKSVV